MPATKPDYTQFNKLFLHHLNRLYFSKCYLAGKTPELTELASFNALKLAIGEFADDLKKQIERMEVIYKIINEIPSDANCNPIKAIIRDNFCLDEKQEMSALVDTDIILYIQMLEHINITACHMLKLLADKLEHPEVKQLLIECFDEAVDNDGLFKLIAKEYLGVE
jgi:ferritin-like metal-binding protein YciE